MNSVSFLSQPKFQKWKQEIESLSEQQFSDPQNRVKEGVL